MFHTTIFRWECNAQNSGIFRADEIFLAKADPFEAA
jgi:hypothetical protein